MRSYAPDSLWRGWPARGRRIGEAANPGPRRFLHSAPLPPLPLSPLPAVVDRALRMMDPLHRAADSEGIMLLRFWGSSGNNAKVLHGQKCGPDLQWAPFVWLLADMEPAKWQGSSGWSLDTPLLVAGLRWKSGPEGGVTLWRNELASSTAGETAGSAGPL